jgi:hypothetical protein
VNGRCSDPKERHARLAGKYSVVVVVRRQAGEEEEREEEDLSNWSEAMCLAWLDLDYWLLYWAGGQSHRWLDGTAQDQDGMKVNVGLQDCGDWQYSASIFRGFAFGYETTYGSTDSVRGASSKSRHSPPNNGGD